MTKFNWTHMTELQKHFSEKVHTIDEHHYNQLINAEYSLELCLLTSTLNKKYEEIWSKNGGCFRHNSGKPEKWSRDVTDAIKDMKSDHSRRFKFVLSKLPNKKCILKDVLTLPEDMVRLIAEYSPAVALEKKMCKKQRFKQRINKFQDFVRLNRTEIEKVPKHKLISVIGKTIWWLKEQADKVASPLSSVKDTRKDFIDYILFYRGDDYVARNKKVINGKSSFEDPSLYPPHEFKFQDWFEKYQVKLSQKKIRKPRTIKP